MKSLRVLHDQVPIHLWRDGADDREEFMTTLGAILRKGNSHVKEIIPSYA